jgi:hypothetical protein
MRLDGVAVPLALSATQVGAGRTSHAVISECGDSTVPEIVPTSPQNLASRTNSSQVARSAMV